jgi:hypothetical protein
VFGHGRLLVGYGRILDVRTKEQSPMNCQTIFLSIS